MYYDVVSYCALLHIIGVFKCVDIVFIVYIDIVYTTIMREFQSYQSNSGEREYSFFLFSKTKENKEHKI